MKSKSELSVFILDDDVLSLAFAQQILRNLGYTNTHLFIHSDNLFEALKTEVADVIFLDYHMEPYNGIDMLYCIKKNYPGVSVIFLSGQEGVQIAVDALSYGAQDYIMKGIGAVRKIAAAMEKKHAKIDIPVLM